MRCCSEASSLGERARTRPARLQPSSRRIDEGRLWRVTVLQRAKVGANALVAAGAVVGEGTEIPDGVLAAGVPAKVKKELAGSSQRWVETAAREYQAKRLRYMG